MHAPEQPLFLYDFNSPYAYLAAARVDLVLPIEPRWQPVALAFMLRAHNRRPWSFDEPTRSSGMADCEQRAAAYGLPPMRWPPGWPIESYGLIALRGAVVAETRGLLREFTQAAFARHFVQGLGLKELDEVLSVAEVTGLDPELVEEMVAAPEAKRRLTEATDAAIAAGVRGVPTVLAAGQAFWGEDHLEAAAAAIAESRSA